MYQESGDDRTWYIIQILMYINEFHCNGLCTAHLIGIFTGCFAVRTSVLCSPGQITCCTNLRHLVPFPLLNGFADEPSDCNFSATLEPNRKLCKMLKSGSHCGDFNYLVWIIAWWLSSTHTYLVNPILTKQKKKYSFQSHCNYAQGN